MITLGEEPKILSMAHSLGIHEGEPVEGIKDFCRKKVARIIAEAPAIRTIEDLERIVCEKLNITIIEIWNDEDLTRIIEQYARREKEIGFADLRRQLDSSTFASLLRRRSQPGDTQDRYVAVIDCRGEKASRRFFTRWHEIAHVLTQFEQLQLPLHRSTIEKDSVEKMMDLIAGDIGFFDPLFQPVLTAELTGRDRITFSSVDKIKDSFCPSASFEATLNACTKRIKSPVIVVQAAMKLKKSEEEALRSLQGEFFPVEKPTPQLRVFQTVSNEAARKAQFSIPSNMRVPAGSVLAKAFSDPQEFARLNADENLNWWRSSAGKVLKHANIHVEAMRVRDRAWGIITLA